MKSVKSMKVKNNWVILSLGLLLLLATLIIFMYNAPHTYSLEELSGGYHFRPVGKNLHDILGSSKEEKDIPADVIDFNYDDDFIIAAQKPEEFNNVIYNQDCVYKDGRSKTYYWIIIHRNKLMLGPLNEKEFIEAKTKYHVPNDLRLKTVD